MMVMFEIVMYDISFSNTNSQVACLSNYFILRGNFKFKFIIMTQNTSHQEKANKRKIDVSWMLSKD